MIKPYGFNNSLCMDAMSSYMTQRMNFMLRCVLNDYRIRLEEISDEDIDRLVLAEFSHRETFGEQLFVPERLQDPEHAKAFLCMALSDLESAVKAGRQVFLSTPAQFLAACIIRAYSEGHNTCEPVSGRVLTAAEDAAESAYRKYGGSFQDRLNHAKRSFGDAALWTDGAFSASSGEPSFLLKGRGSDVRRAYGCCGCGAQDFKSAMAGEQQKEAV